MATYTLNLFRAIGDETPEHSHQFTTRNAVYEWLDSAPIPIRQPGNVRGLIFEIVPTYDDLADALADCVTEEEHVEASKYVLANLVNDNATDKREALARSLRMLLPAWVLETEPPAATSAVTGESCC
jgi:hypothetical protein